MSYRDQILELWLPTKPSRLIAGTSITLGIAAFALPEFLTLLCIKLSDDLTLLLRIATPLLIWLLGSLLVLNVVVQYSKTLKSQKTSSPTITPSVPKPTQLPREQVDILILLSKQGELFTFQITQTLNISKDIAEYHLQKLYKGNFAKQGLPVKPGRPWYITDKGKEYLIENKLIS